MYIAHHAANTKHHKSLRVPKQYVNQFNHFLRNGSNTSERDFAGLMLSLDKSIGKLVNELFRNDMLGNSVIIFTTDNSVVDGFHSSHPFK